MAWRRYVALGDSFTEGLDDPHPTTPGVFRGWADLVAGELSGLYDDFGYANLAIRGRLFDSVAAEQLPLGLAMRPDLVSFAAGGNDVLRRRCDPAALMTRFDEAICRIRDSGADVVIFRFADVLSRLPANRLIAPRVRFLNEAVGEIAERRGAHLVDLWNDQEFANPAMWSIDRLHMSAYGHRRVAAHVLKTLGLTPPGSWWETPNRPERLSWTMARVADARWAGRHLAPWIKRRLTGRSSGDHVVAKRPTMGPP